MSRFEVKNGKVLLSRREWLLIAGSFAATVLSGMLSALNANAVLIFVIAGVALALCVATMTRIRGPIAVMGTFIQSKRVRHIPVSG